MASQSQRGGGGLVTGQCTLEAKPNCVECVLTDSMFWPVIIGGNKRNKSILPLLERRIRA